MFFQVTNPTKNSKLIVYPVIQSVNMHFLARKPTFGTKKFLSFSMYLQIIYCFTDILYFLPCSQCIFRSYTDILIYCTIRLVTLCTYPPCFHPSSFLSQYAGIVVPGHVGYYLYECCHGNFLPLKFPPFFFSLASLWNFTCFTSHFPSPRIIPRT